MLSELIPADAAPFADLSNWAIVGVFITYFLGFFIRGAFGFGSNMPIVLITAWILGPHHAILVVLLASLVAQAHLLPQGVRSADWKVTKPLLAGMLLGSVIGTWAFTVLAGDWLMLVMGLLIGSIVLFDQLSLFERLGRVIDLRSRRVAAVLSLFSGTAGAVSGGGGIYFLAVYLKIACATPASLRGTSMVTAGVLMFVRLTLLIAASAFSLSMVLETTLLVPMIFLGTWTGTRFFRASSPARFYAALQILLLCAALAITVKGIVKII
ncbi:MAG: sulfite exporter TauE/SafE family protein [Rhodospirillales bacterium]|nr:sulfite exporter TauE/SafE family protein [Rhodospirillales bacterium]